MVPLLDNPLLTVMAGSPAARVLVEGGRPAAWRCSGTARSHRCAAPATSSCPGTLASAQLLLLSGTGPADELRVLGIRRP